MRDAITSTLRASGYTQLQVFDNGVQVWNWLEARLKETDELSEIADLLISDVEMPQIDGLHLTKRVKEHPVLNRLPVLLYSSIVTADNRKKGKAVGADAQIAKPELSRVVELADELIVAAQEGKGGFAAGRETVIAEEQGAPSRPTAAPPADVANPVPHDAPKTTMADKPTTKPDELSKSEEANKPEEAKRPLETTERKAAPEPEEATESEEAPQDDAPKAAEAPSSVPATETEKETASGDAKSPGASPAPHTAAPRKINGELWMTFRAELVGRVLHLTNLLDAADQSGLNEEGLNEMFRTLHTVKSASMVVPVDEITQTTHLVESLLESIRDDGIPWPKPLLADYVAWLAELSASPDLDQPAFAAAADLQARLARQVPTNDEA